MPQTESCETKQHNYNYTVHMDVDCSKKGWLAFALSSEESVKKNPGEIAHSIITESEGLSSSPEPRERREPTPKSIYSLTGWEVLIKVKIKRSEPGTSNRAGQRKQLS